MAHRAFQAPTMRPVEHGDVLLRAGRDRNAEQSGRRGMAGDSGVVVQQEGRVDALLVPARHRGVHEHAAQQPTEPWTAQSLGADTGRQGLPTREWASFVEGLITHSISVPDR